MGEKRRAELRKHFGTIKAIREADVEALAAVVPRAAAGRCGNIFTRKTRTSESQRHSRWLFAGDEEKDAAISFDKQSVRKGLVFS